MVINWYGQSCFKITSGELVLAIDPFSKEIGLTPPRFKTDILLKTHDHRDHSNLESIPEGAFIIGEPGEYEIKGVPITGIESFHDDQNGKERGKNTIYKFEVEEIKLAHLGDFGEKEIRSETLDELGDIDILFIPVGGVYTIDAEGAEKIIRQIEPRIVIPMHYKIPGLTVKLAPVDEFLKEMGIKKLEPEEKLVIKKKDLPEAEQTKIVLLKTA